MGIVVICPVLQVFDKEVTSRLGLPFDLKLFEVQAGAAMDSPWIGVAAFACGWFLREWSTAKCPNPQICRCECKVAASNPPEVSSIPPNWLLAFGGVILLAVFGNTALAFWVSYQDSSTGTDRAVSVNVKGKAKGGVYGNNKGLQITN